MPGSGPVQRGSCIVAPSTTGQAITPPPETNKGNKAMKKILIATAAVAALAAGASAAQAKVHFDVNIGLPGVYAPVYEPVGYGYEPDCHYVTVKKVKWVNGYKVVKFKQKLVCYSY
jgi:hypothetical protein